MPFDDYPCGPSSPLDGLVATVTAQMAPPPAPPAPPPDLRWGVYLQIYRGGIRGPTLQARRDRLARYCDAIARMRQGGLVQGVVFHGFCEDLADSWSRLARLAGERSIPALASWGLDAKDLSAERKGDLVGQVLADPTCVAGFLDAEGQWDSDLGAADDMDEAGALALGRALRRRAPRAKVGDQPWYAIEAHGDLRRTVKPIELGGVFRGFPVDEFAVVCDLGRFRQGYIYNDRGAGYRSTYERMDREWGNITPALRAAGLERPLRLTIQAYRWKLHEMVHVLLDRCVRPEEPLVEWCDAWPDSIAMAALEFVAMLVSEGFASVGCDPREAVRAYQRAFNRHAPEHLQLAVDGWAGLDTVSSAGIPLDRAEP